MKMNSIGKAFEKKVTEALEDLGKDITKYQDLITQMGEILIQMNVEQAKGEDISFLAVNFNAIKANLASAAQAISIRELDEFIEEAQEVLTEAVMVAIRLAG